MLERFVQAPVESVVAGAEPIPLVIGIRCLNPGSQNKVDVTRADKGGRVFQRYQAQPVVRELHVGYRQRDGQIDRAAAVLFVVNQVFGVRKQVGGKRVPLSVEPDSPLLGRPHGSREKLAEFLARWRTAFAKLCEGEGIARVFRIVQGCVVEQADGTRFQFRNFDKGGEWMRSGSFRDIVAIHRSPLRLM
jgi:hypothetical protein